MDESGNILLKRLGKSPVYVKVNYLKTCKCNHFTITSNHFQNTPEDSAVSNDLLKLNNGLVDIEKVRF